MKRIPNAREVEQALKAVRTAVKHALKGLNQDAGQLMAKGDYAAAEALAAKGREIQEFQAQVDALSHRWLDLRGTGDVEDQQKRAATPLWAYYQPILKSLVQAGGEAHLDDLEAAVERNLFEIIQEGDRAKMPNGCARWQVMIRRARKHLIAEGWAEDGVGKALRITESGRRAAEKPVARTAKPAK